ncbi:OsmC family protein [Tropicibacter sp. R15_0]|uniref:OsmC family protein n=1 Tax=Tropicibacter sp. R15_0 TaxID=2821101 RepID=UPI001ADA4E08|nr:OsmC family protein [Tropicibacter sp. R15_0]MBO9465659.1 OsmC family protein [Tropicibacter sp. R15_0]
MTQIVTRAASKPELATMPPFPKPVITPGEPIRFAYEVMAEPGPGQSKRGVIISPRADYSSWEVLCDEGTAMGGDDAAPSPLGYLIMGVAFCLLTHIQGYLHKAPMQIDKIKVEIRAEYGTLPPEPDQGQQGAGLCDAYTAHVIIDSPEPQEKLENLIRVCRDACMAIATVATAVPTSTRVFINGTENGVEV